MITCVGSKETKCEAWLKNQKILAMDFVFVALFPPGLRTVCRGKYQDRLRM